MTGNSVRARLLINSPGGLEWKVCKTPVEARLAPDFDRLSLGAMARVKHLQVHMWAPSIVLASDQLINRHQLPPAT